MRATFSGHDVGNLGRVHDPPDRVRHKTFFEVGHRGPFGLRLRREPIGQTLGPGETWMHYGDVDPVRCHLPRCAQITQDFDLDLLADQIIGGRREIARFPRTPWRRSRVHQDVDTSEFVDHRLHERAHGFLVAGVGGDTDHSTSGLLRQLRRSRGERIRAASRKRDIHTFQCKTSGHRSPDAPATACHDRPLTAQSEIHVPTLLVDTPVRRT